MLTFSRFATEETLSATEVRSLIECGKIAATTLLQRSDSTHWIPAAEFEELRSAFERAPRVAVHAPKPLRRFEPKFTEKPVPSSAIPIRFVGVWFFVLAAWAVVSSCPQIVRHRESERWPAAEATAVGWSQYQYSVNGRTYVGTHPEGSLHRGQQFSVRYDPARPEISETNPGLDMNELMGTGVFAIFGVLGMVMLIAPEKVQRSIRLQ